MCWDEISHTKSAVLGPSGQLHFARKGPGYFPPFDHWHSSQRITFTRWKLTGRGGDLSDVT